MIQELRAKLASLDNLRKLEERRKQQLETKLTVARDEKETLEQAIKLCDFCLKEQVEVMKHIEEMGTAFISVFDESLSVKFDTMYKADKVTMSGVKPVAYLNGEVDRPSEGQKTIMSSGLQTVFLKLKAISQTMILDEYLADVSPTIVPSVVRLWEKMGIQVILATHQDVEFPCTYKVFKRGSTSYVEKQNK